MSTHKTTRRAFREVVEVRLVNIDVFVSDKKGRPISGLSKEDFELYEDGRPVEITHFREGWGSAPRTETGTPTADRAPGTAAVGLSRGREPIWAVLFLDNLSLEPKDRRRILDDLTRFADAHSSDEVRFMLASFDVGLRIEKDFSSDPTQLAAALEASASGSMHGRQDAMEYRKLFADVQSIYEIYSDTPCAPCDCGWAQMVAVWDQYALASSDRLRRSTNGLAELVSSLGGLPGQKALFYVSSGLQQRPGISALNYLADVCPNHDRDVQTHFFDHDETRYLTELAARANANQVTLYTIDAGGARAEGSASVDFDSRRFRPSPVTTQARRLNLQSSLFYLAHQTGGEAILNDNSPFARLQRIAGDFESYYSLGFSPARAPDRRSHSVRVELPMRPKARLRFRRSHRDKPEDERLGDQLLATLRLGATSNPLGITARAGVPKPAGDDFFEVLLHITLPLEKLIKVKDGEERKSLLRVLLAAEDDRGRRTEIREKTVELVFSGRELPPTHEFTVTLRLGPGPHRIGVGVLDQLARTGSYARVALDPAPSVP